MRCIGDFMTTGVLWNPLITSYCSAYLGLMIIDRNILIVLNYNIITYNISLLPKPVEESFPKIELFCNYAKFQPVDKAELTPDTL